MRTEYCLHIFYVGGHLTGLSLEDIGAGGNEDKEEWEKKGEEKEGEEKEVEEKESK